MTGKRRLLLIAVAVLALGLGIGAALWLRQDPAPSPPPEDLALPDLEGRLRHLSDWKGKTLLLNFWATWCAPCREEIPLLKDAQARYGERGLQVIGIAIDELADVAAYSRDMQIHYPILIADLSTFSLMHQYGNRSGSLPYSVILLPDGSISSRKLGAYHAAELHEAIQNALPGAK